MARTSDQHPLTGDSTSGGSTVVVFRLLLNLGTGDAHHQITLFSGLL